VYIFVRASFSIVALSVDALLGSSMVVSMGLVLGAFCGLVGGLEHAVMHPKKDSIIAAQRCLDGLVFSQVFAVAKEC
jgi:hypothetical protein